MNQTFDLDQVELLLSTTRAVRRRLDFDRDVPDELLLDCVRLSQQAPTGSNGQTWRWIIVRDPDKKVALADLYRSVGGTYLRAGGSDEALADAGPEGRFRRSAVHLAENFHRAPALVIPCVRGRLEKGAAPVLTSSTYGSIYPAIWSFQLALRSRGLGSCITTLHLVHEGEAADLLGIPDDVMQVALIPVAYTIGSDFRPAERPPAEYITSFDTWGNKHTP